MRFLRKKVIQRTLCAFSIILALNGIIFPNVSYAITTGPHQPEFTSYEEASATDMVNLLTGDFNFNMPILSVPIGTDAEFTLPLSYHAGISPDQEASWIGLGWNANVGSITRGINGFPDDANNDPQVVTVQDLTGRRGWSSSIIGIINSGWDSQEGYYGAINLGLTEVGFDSNGGYVGIAGLMINGDGVTFSAEGFAMALVQVAMALVTQGLSEAFQTMGVAGDILSTAFDIANYALMVSSQLSESPTPNSPSMGYWEYTKETENNIFYTNYWIWLDQSRIEDMYGALYLDKAPTISNQNQPNYLNLKTSLNGADQPVNQFPVTGSVTNRGAASDINIDLSSTSNYIDNTSPTLLAYDNFNVNGPGISGGIKPYRMEVGSVGVPREMTANHTRLTPVPYLDYGTNKVPFVYDGAMGGRYLNHGGDPTASVTRPGFNFGVGISYEIGTGSTGNNYNSLRYNLNDVVLGNQRIGADATSRKELAQGHYVDWLTNAETNVAGGYTGTAYMDYFRPVNRSLFRGVYEFGGRKSYFSSTINGQTITLYGAEANDFTDGQLVDLKVTVKSGSYPRVDLYQDLAVISHTSSTLVLNSSSLFQYNSLSVLIEITSKSSPKSTSAIGGFVITDPSGMNYHYSLPVYDYDFYSETIDKSDNNKRSIISRTAPFANTWLLTAITGPDFVDRGGSGNNGDGFVDDSDWGYWVKFNYGKNGKDFAYALPFNKNKTTSDNNYYTYAKGLKEKYFLNSIESRSHVAMFIKSDIQHSNDANNSKATLRLTEINLVTKDVYNQLTSTKYQLPAASGSIAFCYTDNMFSGSAINTYRGNYMRASSIKRLLFNQDYSLCQGVPNSTSGKLTLKSLAVCGKYDSISGNLSKIFPDYKFEYAVNPNFHPDKWDGWGMHNSMGDATGFTHKSSPLDSDGSAWSLTKITNPEGSEIAINYERDTYTNISGNPFPSSDAMSIWGSNTLNQGQSGVFGFYVNDASRLKVGDPLSFIGNVDYVCPTNSSQNGSTQQSNSFGTSGVISSINGTAITMSTPYATPWKCGIVTSAYTVNTTGTAKPEMKRGGNIRVSSIVLSDPTGQSYKTQYLYANGSVSSEPDYIKTSDLSFYNYLNYPTTPVMYGQVTVLTGKLTTISDYHSSQVYEFVTPNSNQYSITTNTLKNKELASQYPAGFPVVIHKDYASLIEHQISLRTNQIGKLKSVKTYDKIGTLTASTDYIYTESVTNDNVNNYQGIYSEGTLLFEAVINSGTNDRYHRGQRTTQFSYPYTLQRVVSMQDGFTSKSENYNWDFITGAILETRETSPQGVYTQQIIEPAYQFYSEFDSKAKNPAYKNMLSQNRATYLYKLDPFGSRTGLIAATANVWKKDWDKYRILDVNNNYIDSPDATVPQVWRMSDVYSWRGNYARMLTDGSQSYSNADKFNFSSIGSNTMWKKVNSKVRYNHFSTLLESKDINEIYTSAKLGYNDQLTIAAITNAQYEEFAFSGAEDLIQSGLSSPYFGGEVNRGLNTSVVNSPVHSGAKALSVSSGYGFIYKSLNLTPNKTYRASVWTNSTDGRIYYKLNNGSEILSAAPTIQTKVGSWYRIDALINTGLATSIEVGVKSSSGSQVIFDDFRFQPLQSDLTTYVYNPNTRAIEYVLDNDNLYIRYQYDNRGVLMKTFRESIQFGGEKLVSENKDDYKRFHTNQ
jgi:hypothetical protein